MTFTTDPPLISDLSLIPGTDEKADLNAPAGSGGKLVIGQAPNITITETTVVADAAERLALDVQEGDVAIQTNVSTSFIFTGGDNIAPNWQEIDFDAVGAIAGENIAPGDVTASGDMSMQNLSFAGTINGADTSAAAAGEALTSDGSGGFNFASAGGGALSNFTVSDLAESSAGTNVLIKNNTTLNDLINNGDFNAIAQSEIAMYEVGLNTDVMVTLQNNSTAVNILDNATVNGGQGLEEPYTNIEEFQETPFMFLTQAKAFEDFNGAGSRIRYRDLSGQFIEFATSNGDTQIFPNEFVTDLQMRGNFDSNQGGFIVSGSDYDFVPVGTDRIVD